MSDSKKMEISKDNFKATKKMPYSRPEFKVYGTLHRHTQGSGGNGEDGTLGMTKMSDRRVKHNIVRVGTHSRGFGLYLFDYLPGHPEQKECGRQFGVIADEVEKVMPQAVTVSSDGYKRVNYGMLGIELNS